MKKYISIALVAVMVVFCLCACGRKAGGNSVGKSDRLQIVTTIFPEYDWVKQILGSNADNADITMLLDNGVDLHSFQPTAGDILKISTCDMFVYVGGESDEWVEDALKEATNKDMVVINLLDALGDLAKEEHIEGMEHEHEEEHDHEHEGEHEEEHEHELDEHVWLSLKNAEMLCGAIADGLCKIDPANSDVYSENAKEYTKKLMELDAKYKETVDAAAVRTLLFGDRFPFRYMADDYGLGYYAAFSGCSAETEASFETIIFLAGKVDELNLGCVLTIEKSDQRIAKTIIENAKGGNQKILSLDSMQSTTSKDVAGGATYLSIMESNLEVLAEALK